MSRSSQKARKERRKQRKRDERVGVCNTYGYRDYTTYGALTGNKVMSKSTLSNPQIRVHGSYNG
jgi:hypothetical protein